MKKAGKVEHLHCHHSNWWQKYTPGQMDGWMGGKVGGWMGVKAILGIVYSNQKFYFDTRKPILRKNNNKLYCIVANIKLGLFFRFRATTDHSVGQLSSCYYPCMHSRAWLDGNTCWMLEVLVVGL